MPMARNVKRSRGTRLGGTTGKGIEAERADDVRAASTNYLSMGLQHQHCEHCCAVQISITWHKSTLRGSPPPRRGRSHTLGGAACAPATAAGACGGAMQALPLAGQGFLRGVVIKLTVPVRQASRSELCSHSKLSGLHSTTNVPGLIACMQALSAPTTRHDRLLFVGCCTGADTRRHIGHVEHDSSAKRR